jgi:cytochrome c oxidase subunit 2
MSRVVPCFLAFTLTSVLMTLAMADDSVIPQRYQYCTVCHGAVFQGNRSTDAPNLSILSAWYIERQLLNFKNHYRGALDEDLLGREMQPMVEQLDESEIAEIASIINTAPAIPSASEVTSNETNDLTNDVKRGAKLYQTCVACHGANAMGNEALSAPRLAGQQDWYLTRQLANYRNGSRGSAQGDQPGALMRASVAMLKDDDAVLDVVAYIHSLSNHSSY